MEINVYDKRWNPIKRGDTVVITVDNSLVVGEVDEIVAVYEKNQMFTCFGFTDITHKTLEEADEIYTRQNCQDYAEPNYFLLCVTEDEKYCSPHYVKNRECIKLN